jgi:hypothetical protein
VILRIVSLVALAWALGFALFMLTLGKPLDPGVKTDAIVVPTGGAGRIDRGIAVLSAKSARRMLITGTDPTVRPIELAVQYKTPPRLFRCCIDLGHDAVDTRSNADETAAWVRQRGYKSVRLVTADWHMARAARTQQRARRRSRGDGRWCADPAAFRDAAARISQISGAAGRAADGNRQWLTGCATSFSGWYSTGCRCRSCWARRWRRCSGRRFCGVIAWAGPAMACGAPA